jgi:hypothetical protein
MEQKQNVNEEVDHNNEAFYANGFGVWVNQNEATIDFRNTLPRTDMVNGSNLFSIVTKHSTVVLPAYMSKMLLIILKEQVDALEKATGEIKLPDNWRASKPKDGGSTTGKVSYIR